MKANSPSLKTTPTQAQISVNQMAGFELLVEGAGIGPAPKGSRPFVLPLY